MKCVVIGMAVAVSLAYPAGARAQEQRTFVRPTVGGVTVAGPGASFSAAVVAKATDRVQILGEAGRMINILPKSVADQVEIAAALAANARGGKHSATSSADANYGLVGLRGSLREVSGAPTFVEVGVGVARVTSQVTAVLRGSATLQGDISSSVSTPFTSATPETKPMISVGGGIVLGVGRTTAVEVGARYLRVFTTDTAINAANIFGGFRFGF